MRIYICDSKLSFWLHYWNKNRFWTKIFVLWVFFFFNVTSWKIGPKSIWDWVRPGLARPMNIWLTLLVYTANRNATHPMQRMLNWFSSTCLLLVDVKTLPFPKPRAPKCGETSSYLILIGAWATMCVFHMVKLVKTHLSCISTNVLHRNMAFTL